MSFRAQDYCGRLLVGDGDFSLELSLRIGRRSSPIEQANIHRPEVMREIAEAFLDAGAEVLVTNTACANPIAMAEMLGPGQVSEGDIRIMDREGAAICRAAIEDCPGGSRLVFGAMGPTGRLLMLDEIAETDLYQAYGTQATMLAEGGADAILCQSFTELDGLCIAIRAAIGATGLPVIGSMAFDSGADRTETAVGVTVPQACASIIAAGACAVGADCGESPDDLPVVVARLRECCQVPIWSKVNAGIPQVLEGRVIYAEGAEDFGGRLAALASAGANFVGGCCGASLQHIASLAAICRSFRAE
jgi:methionine synthase I (cobalamin-dependent)